MANLAALFEPESVAVAGAGSRAGNFGGQVVRNLDLYGFPGEIYPIHPKEDEVLGRAAAASLGDLPAVPDCVVIALGNRATPGVLEEAASLGVGAAVVFADPNSTPDPDADTEALVRRIALDADMALAGMNSMGLYNLKRATVISGYTMDPGMPAGNVALLSHSGSVWDSLTQAHRFGTSVSISLGNETLTTMGEIISYAAEDTATNVIGLYLEAVRDPESFIGGLEHAAALDVPVVALKVGVSDRGAEMAQAHTGALAGSPEAYAAVFRRHRVLQADTLDEMLETLTLLSGIRDVPADGVTVLMDSGGERSLLADRAESMGLPLTELAPQTRAALADVLDDGKDTANPLDAFSTAAGVSELYADCFRILDGDSGTGLLLFAADLQRWSGYPDEYLVALQEVWPRLRKPLATLVGVPWAASESVAAAMTDHGMPVLYGMDAGLRAINHLLARRRPPWDAAVPKGRPGRDDITRLRQHLEDAPGPLDEHQSTALLAAYGISVAAARAASSKEDVAAAAAELGYPVVMKTMAPGVLHKSEGGGVKLALEDDEALAAAYQELEADFGPEALVQKHVTGGHELILGMTKDDQFGPIIVLGLGGVLVEILDDVATALPGLGKEEATALPGLLRGGRVLDGARGTEPIDRAALTDTLQRFSTLVTDLGDLLAELDINPLNVSASGAIALDALAVPAP